MEEKAKGRMKEAAGAVTGNEEKAESRAQYRWARVPGGSGPTAFPERRWSPPLRTRRAEANCPVPA
jgi:hypothetical protein